MQPVHQDNYSPRAYLDPGMFRWVVGGMVGIIGALVGIVWVILWGQVGELKTQLSQMTNSVYTMQGDIALLSQQSVEQSAQINELRGALKRK